MKVIGKMIYNMEKELKLVINLSFYILGQDRSKYCGEYFEGKKHGKGKYEWADGSYYDGDWKDNKINGFGTYKWADGRGYTGEWLDNNMNGKGVY